MSAKRARNQAKRAKRKGKGKRALRDLRERHNHEARRAGAHGLEPWTGPERQRKAKRLLTRAREALRESGVRTKADAQAEANERVVLPSEREQKVINDALERRKEGDDG